MITDKIYVVGFLCSGKSTLAAALAGRLKWPCADVDELVEMRERASVAAIFATRGEAYFRAVERDVLFQLLRSHPAVVATGAGTFAEPDNRAAINADGVSVWLEVPFDEILLRLPQDGRRPLPAERTRLEQLFAARRFAYQQAHVHVNASRAPVEELVERVLLELGW